MQDGEWRLEYQFKEKDGFVAQIKESKMKRRIAVRTMKMSAIKHRKTVWHIEMSHAIECGTLDSRFSNLLS